MATKCRNSSDYFSSIHFNYYQSSGSRSFPTVNKLKFDLLDLMRLEHWNGKHNILSIFFNKAELFSIDGMIKKNIERFSFDSVFQLLLSLSLPIFNKLYLF